MLEKGMSQVDLAKKSGIKQPLISNYLNESKSAKMPSLQTLVTLAGALHCTPNDLLGWPAEKPFPDRSLLAWEAYLKLPPDDPRRKAIEVLLGIDLIGDAKESGD